jgi:hypothetical protein
MNKVFPIIGKSKISPEKYMILGTGFFINTVGYFTTAGHVFRDNRNACEQFYICFPKGNEYVDLFPIAIYKFYSKKIYNDRERLKNDLRPRYEYQCGPEYIDVAVGKVEITITDCFEFKKKRSYEWNKLNMPCFNRNKETCTKNEFTLKDGKVNSLFIEFHNWDLRLRERLRLARIPFLYETMEFDNVDLYNNCIEVYGNGTKGNSGAPVLNENGKVIGIYVAGADFNNLRTVLLSRSARKRVSVLIKLIERKKCPVINRQNAH